MSLLLGILRCPDERMDIDLTVLPQPTLSGEHFNALQAELPRCFASAEIRSGLTLQVCWLKRRWDS
eukprot:scaffold2714_cov89-Skeletonema_dohrnii-CCMP3373.AAC.2